MVESDWIQLIELVIIPLVILGLSYISEKGFENLISQMIVEKWLKPLKPYQPLLVSVVGIILAYLSKRMGIDLLPDLAPYLTATGDVGTVFAGLIIAVLSMAMHTNYTNKIAAPVG